MDRGPRLADFDIIDDATSLEAFAKDLLKEKVVAVDTEADSFYHYFDKTCLVQVGTRKKLYLVDPLALGGPAELAPLAPVFASTRRNTTSTCSNATVASALQICSTPWSAHSCSDIPPSGLQQ